MAQIALMQLVDHVTKGAESWYYVYGTDRCHLVTKTYNEAVEMFDSLNEVLNPYIALATRIGTVVTLKSKGKAFDDTVNFVGIRDV